MRSFHIVIVPAFALTFAVAAFLAAALPVAAQDATPDTRRDSASERADPENATILVSIDGFRPDYLERGITPKLNALKTKGVSAAMRPSFPTKTFPNHYALVTGLVPDHHGITGNSIIDPARPGKMFSLGDPRQSLDPFWWNEAEPVWVTAEKRGLRTATMFWPGSEVAIHGTRPSDWQRFDQNIDNAQRVRTVIDWMRRPADSRPHFVTLYFDTVDLAGHIYGPNSDETNTAIAEADTRIGELVAGLKALGVSANLVVVSDHGMIEVNAARTIQLNEIIDAESYIAVESGPYAQIEPVTGTDDRVAAALLTPHEHMDCHAKEDLPERLHFGSNPRVAAIVCIADSGWSILSGEPRYPVAGGDHGFDNADPGMLALFVASGPDIDARGPLETFDNVEVYPLLAHLIGIAPLASDASGSLAQIER